MSSQPEIGHPKGKYGKWGFINDFQFVIPQINYKYHGLTMITIVRPWQMCGYYGLQITQIKNVHYRHV